MADSGIPRRIIKETQKISEEPIPGIRVIPKPGNPRYFDVVLAGPEGGPFAGGNFKLEMFLPEGYPMTPPKIRFLTRVYHPNIDQLGRICLDVLKDKWSPALQMRTILMSIQALMDHPCTEDPLDTTINKHYLEDPEDAAKTAREWTAKFAI